MLMNMEDNNDGIRFIAEVSSNHFQDLGRCLAFIDAAAETGCWGVKFQLFKINELFSREILEKSPVHRKRKDWELPVSFIPEIAEHCRMRNIAFGCTPFYLHAVHELYPYVDFYKIASYEILWRELFEECSQTGKPLMMSTGMATLDEIGKAVEWIGQTGCEDLTVFHCVSGYPTPVWECNLKAIQTLRGFVAPLVSKEGQVAFGWSDHSVNPGVLYRAIHKWDAKVIEFHLDIDGKGEEFAAGHCWLPEMIAPVIQSVKQGLRADGNGVKEPVPSELADRQWRADPGDGLRPLIPMRATFNG
ncbi:MAG: N-acetylneuraminate synthase family protein [Desulfobacteraceae bacterium]|nr:N-acetylneuraminate synthase family protein [Desulfobacteraceae bacterium]